MKISDLQPKLEPGRRKLGDIEILEQPGWPSAAGPGVPGQSPLHAGVSQTLASAITLEKLHCEKDIAILGPDPSLATHARSDSSSGTGKRRQFIRPR